MKIAFSTVACPKWDFETICTRAREYGYDGVEIRGFLNESILTASNLFLSDPKKIRAMFEYHKIEIACLASSIAMTGKRAIDAGKADEVRLFVEMAAAVGCGIVKIFDTQVRPGQSRPSAGGALGEWLAPLGEYAADRDVCIVVENALSFRASKEIWMILERANHPNIGCCWDVFNAALIGEQPAISVPTLNNRIQYTQVKDAKLGPMGASYCPLGEGDVPVRKFLTRLRGIGYEGYVTFEWEKAWLPNIAEPEEILPAAAKTLRDWISPAPPPAPAKPEPAEKKPVAAK